MTMSFTAPVDIAANDIPKADVVRQDLDYFVTGASSSGTTPGTYIKAPSIGDDPVSVAPTGDFPSITMLLGGSAFPGTTYSAWQQPNAGATDTEIRGAVTTHLGFVITSVLISGTIPRAEHPQVAGSVDGNMHVVFQSTDAEEIYYAISANVGTDHTWSTPELIGLGTMPDLTTDDDNQVHVVYNSYAPDYGIRYRLRSAAGVWGPEQVVSYDAHSRDVSIAVTPDKIGIVWNKWDTGEVAFVRTDRLNWVIEEFMPFQLFSRWGHIASANNNFYMISQNLPHGGNATVGAEDWWNIKVWRLAPGEDWTEEHNILVTNDPDMSPNIAANYLVDDDAVSVSAVYSAGGSLFYFSGSDGTLIEGLAARQESASPPDAAPTWDDRGIMIDPNADPALETPVEQENPKEPENVNPESGS